ncbi:DUF637 domain-containing protein [Halomonas organivorans]
MNMRRPWRRYLAFLLINALFWQPVMVLAGGMSLAPDGGNTSLDEAGNGVPVIHIATPNERGLSHNTFADYNVDERGVILNNSTRKLQSTQLGGLIVGNPNLRGRAAELILNEVNGSEPSRLEGYTEVAGEAAPVVVANPHGIVCDGCGFLNTPRVALSTGTPVIEGDDLARFSVEGGRVAIEGLGLDASRVDRFDIITRAAELNAEIHARHLNVVTGTNAVDAETLELSEHSNGGEAPRLAVDASALGGMYADSIRLVGTEDGVGVKLAGDMAAKAGDIRLDVDGELRLADAVASERVVIDAEGVSLDGDVHAGEAVTIDARRGIDLANDLSSRGDITLTARESIHNDGRVIAGVDDQGRHPGADLTLSAGEIDNTGWFDATERLAIEAEQLRNDGSLLASEIEVAAGQRVDNSGVIQGERVALESEILQNEGEQATLAGSSRLDLQAERLANREGLLQFGPNQDVYLELGWLDNTAGRLLLDGGELAAHIDHLANRGGRLEAHRIGIEAESVDNSEDGLIAATEEALRLDVQGRLHNGTGRLQAATELVLEAETFENAKGMVNGAKVELRVAENLDNREGVISADEAALVLQVQGDVDNAGGSLQSRTGSLRLEVSSLDNRGGTLVAAQAMDIASQGDFDNGADGLVAAEHLRLEAEALDNAGGSILADEATLALGALSNGQGLVGAERDLLLELAGPLDNRRGRLQASRGELSVMGTPEVDNARGIMVADRLRLSDIGDILNPEGELIAEGIDIQASTLDNGEAGVIAAGGDGMRLALDLALDNDGGLLQSGNDLVAEVPRFDNRHGRLIARTVSLSASQILNASGTLLADSGGLAMTLAEAATRGLDNRGGSVVADGSLLIHGAGAEVENADGFLGGRRLILSVETLSNGEGRVMAGRSGLSLEASRVDNRLGLMIADDGEIEASIGRLDNRGGALVAGRGDLDLHASYIDNAGGTVESSRRLELGADALNNVDGELRALGSEGESRVVVTGRLDNETGRIAVASEDLRLEARHLVNARGEIHHAGDGVLRLLASVLEGQEGELQGTGDGRVALGRIPHLGRWLFDGDLTLELDEGLETESGERIATSGRLDMTLGGLANQGELLADQGLILEVEGNIANRGLISSQDDLEVGAHHLMQHGGRLVSGSEGHYRLEGRLDNQGRLLGLGDIDIEAAAIDNRGILGGRQNLRLASGSDIHSHPDTLLFSGGDMTLRGERLLSRNGDIYSLGRLDFAKDDDLGLASRLENRSGVIEAGGDIRIAARDVINTKETYREALALIDRRLSVEAYQLHAYGKHRDDGFDGTKEVRWVHVGTQPFFDYDVVSRHETRILEDSPQARLLAGGDMEVHAHELLNSNSLIAANGDLRIQAGGLRNLGAGRESVERVIAFGDPLEGLIPLGDEYRDPSCHGRCVDFDYAGLGYRYRVTQGTMPVDLASEVANWNAHDGRDRHGADLPLPAELTSADQLSEVVTRTAQAGGDRAVIAAGGRVRLEVDDRLDNGSVESGALSQLSGEVGEVAMPGANAPVVITLGRRVDDPETPVAPSPEATERAPGSASSRLDEVDRQEEARYRDHDIERVAPSQLPSYRLPEGRYGLFVRNRAPRSRYLIETNPALTDIERLMGSDYLLDKLEYSSDGTYRLLGDGRYESRLVRDAVLGVTGRRFLTEGIASDYEQYRYLMDNAAAAQEALQLRVGVGLTQQQVQSLTTDIVWLEEQEVEGETVLVPVLYLAEADGRDLRGSSVVHGRDVEMMVGGDLVNVGTLHADQDLALSSGGSILQGGLLQAGQRLEASARDSIRNALAGEIRANQVELETLRGDIVNVRTAVTAGDALDYRTYLDRGGLIAAREGLVMTAGRDAINRADIESGGNLALTAGRDIVHSAVSDARREARTHGAGLARESVSFLGAGLSAAGDAVLTAGRDVLVSASDAESGGEMSLGAGRDIRLEAASNTARAWGETEASTWTRPESVDDRSITQRGSRLTSGAGMRLIAGHDVRLQASEAESGEALAVMAAEDIQLASGQRSHRVRFLTPREASHSGEVVPVGSMLHASEDIALRAGGDVTAVASRIEAGDDLAVEAGQDLTLASAQHLRHEQSRTATTETITRRGRQRGSEIRAGGELAMGAGRDLSMIASEARAGDDASLLAGDEVFVLAADEQDYSLYEKEESGLFSSRYQRDEVNDIRAVGSRVHTGGDLAIVSGGDQVYQDARLVSSGDLQFGASGEVRFETARDLHSESHEKHSGNFAWQSARGEGATDETLHQNVLIAPGNVAIRAAEGIMIEMPDVDARTVGETIDAMVEADPDLGWLKSMADRGDVDWHRVKALHDSWRYDRSGLGAGAALAISIVASAFVGPAAAGAAGLTGASGAALGAAASSLASTGAVGVINHRGDLGAALDDTFSEDGLRGALMAAASAGLAQELGQAWGGKVDPTTGATSGLDLSDLEGIGRFAGQRASQAGIDAGIRTALQGGSLEDHLGDGLQSALVHVASGVLFHAVGDVAQGRFEDGSAEKVALHGLVGGALSEAMGGDFKSGALAAGASEVLADHLVETGRDNPALSQAVAQLVGLAAAGLAGGDRATGALLAGQVESYNRQLHAEEVALARELAASSDRYTQEELEQGLRGLYNDALDESPGDHVVVDLSHELDVIGSSYFDYGGEWISTPGADGKTRYLVQKVPTDTPPDVIAYIIDQTGGADSPYRAPIYELAPEEARPGQPRDRLTGRPLNEDGQYIVSYVVDGRTYDVPHNPCGDAECLAQGGNVDYTSPNAREWALAVDLKALDEVGRIATGVTAVSPLGAAGQAAAAVGFGASVGASYIRGELAKEGGSQFLSKSHEVAFKELLGAGLGVRLNAALSILGYYGFLVEGGLSDEEIERFVGGVNEEG